MLLKICQAVRMWDTFFADLIVALVGAGLTVAIALFTYLGRINLEERRALQLLINDLHGRRALTADPASRVPFASVRRPYKYANASVLALRDEVKATRTKVRQRERLRTPLNKMIQACNRYLELSEFSPGRYPLHLSELQRSLSLQVETLAKARRGLAALEPGGGAFEAAAHHVADT